MTTVAPVATPRPAHQRWSIVSRVFAAVVGGYAVTSLLTLALPLGLASLGVNQAQTLMAAAMMSFPIYAGIVMAVFHARTASRAWMWLVGLSLPLLILVFALLPDAPA